MDKDQLAGLQLTCKESLQKWCEKTGENPQTSKKINLSAQIPSIKKLDNSLSICNSCEHLSLSTNQIDRINGLNNLKNLKILSIGRNYIKRIEKLEDNNELEQLWCSYNQIEKLDGLSNNKKLRVLYISNNQIKQWDELLKLRDLPNLEELLLVGNPIYDDINNIQQRRIEVIKRLPKLKKLDAVLVTELEVEAAQNQGQQNSES